VNWTADLRMNDVTLRLKTLVLIVVYLNMRNSRVYTTSVFNLANQVNSALHPSGVAKSSIPAVIGWGKGGNVTSAGCQVTACDPVWHASSRGVVRRVCELLYAVYSS